MKKLGLLFGIVLVMVACDNRDISVLEDFGFAVETQYDLAAKLLEPHRIDLEIQPVNFVEGTTYSLQYHVEGANGMLMDGENNAITPREAHGLANFENSFYFMASEPGSLTLYATIEDSYGSTQDLEIALSVAQVGFDFSGLVAVPSIYIGESTEISFNLSQDRELPIDYTLQYLFRSNQGIVTDANGNELKPNESVPVNPGDLKFQFESVQIGMVEMEFLLKDEFGTEIMVPISIEVEQTDFSFSVAPVRTQADTEEIVGLNFNFELLGVEELDYTVTFSSTEAGHFTIFSSTFDWITNGDEQDIAPNLVSQGEWSGFYRGMDSGDHDVTVTITASNGISHSQSFSINFYSRPIIHLVKTGLRKYNKRGCFNGCDYDWDYLIFMDVAFNEGATYKTVILTIWDDRTNQYREFNLGNYGDLQDYQGYKIFTRFRDIEAGGVYQFNNQLYRLTVRDSNDKESDTFTGRFTNDPLDSE